MEEGEGKGKRQRIEKVKSVLVHSCIGLWVMELGDVKSSFRRLLSYQEAGLPLCAAAFKCESNIFFVGGEKPYLHPKGYDDVHIGMFDRLALPETLNKVMYKYNLSDLIITPQPQPEYAPSCAYPKPSPLVVTVINSETHTPLFYVFGRDTAFAFWVNVPPGPSFEVYDPSLLSWTTPPQPPYRGYPIDLVSAFELGGFVFLLVEDYDGGYPGHYELSFCLKSNRWSQTHLFLELHHWIPRESVIPVAGLSNNIRIGCSETSVNAYKLCDGGSRIVVQPLTQVMQSTQPIFGIDTILCDIGDQEVLFLNSSREWQPGSLGSGRFFASHPFGNMVHYYALKLNISETSPIDSSLSTSTPHFVEACTSGHDVHEVVEIKDLEEVRHKYAVLSAFVV